MATVIPQVTPINLPNPRTVLIRVPLQNGGEALGYPTREFMALLRQFSVRVGGTGGDVDIINPDPDILAPLDPGAPEDAALAAEPVVMMGIAQLQDMIAQAVAVEVSIALGQRQAEAPAASDIQAAPEQSSPLALEMTMGEGFEPV
ncbi:hypothetical protein D9M68_409450 [compost metagenome]